MNWLALGAISGLLSVAAGAFGAHGLRSVISAEALAWWHTAAQYQIYHSLALVALGVWGKPAPAAGWAFLVGILVFSGTLYAMALTGARWLGAVTPIGGVSLMIGWAAFAWAALRSGKPL